VEIQKVDALRHQIDLAVLQPEGFDQAGEDVASSSDATDEASDDAPAPAAAEG
jgi:ribonuclease R